MTWLLLEIDPSIPLLVSVFGTLGTLFLGTLAFRQRDAEMQSSALERDQALRATQSLVQAKADNDYVEGLENRLDRAWKRIDVADERLKKAEEELEECKKAKDEMAASRDEMAAKIRTLEARLGGTGA